MSGLGRISSVAIEHPDDEFIDPLVPAAEFAAHAAHRRGDPLIHRWQSHEYPHWLMFVFMLLK